MQFDIVIRNATVIDGTGSPAYLADLGISNKKIAALAQPQSKSINGAVIIDATGLVVSPGFIDVHTHDDRELIDHPAMLP